jgi:hypothetical protein
MTEKDNKNLELIKKFLEEEGIEYSYSNAENDDTQGIFVVKSAKGTDIEIRYVNSITHKMDMTKRLGIPGLDKNYFINISHKNHDNGIRTIWIKDFEIDESKTINDMNGKPIENYHRKWEVIKSLIRTSTGHIHNRYYARDCEIREVPNSQLRPFLDMNCFYGYRSASINLGLYAKKDKGNIKRGELLFVYTFGSGFYSHNKEGQLEVIRVCTVKNTQVLGGSSKCIKYFLNTYKTVKIGQREFEPKSLLFYVDADHNDSSSMNTLGYDFISWKGNGFINMYTETGETFQRKPLIHKQIMQMMGEGKVISIANAGTIVYTLDKDLWLKSH